VLRAECECIGKGTIGNRWWMQEFLDGGREGVDLLFKRMGRNEARGAYGKHGDSCDGKWARFWKRVNRGVL